MKPSAAFSRFFLFRHTIQKNGRRILAKNFAAEEERQQDLSAKRIGFFADERAAIRRIKALIICIKPPAPVRWILRIFHPKKP